MIDDDLSDAGGSVASATGSHSPGARGSNGRRAAGTAAAAAAATAAAAAAAGADAESAGRKKGRSKGTGFKRGPYKCGRCGQQLKGHICPFKSEASDSATASGRGSPRYDSPYFQPMMSPTTAAAAAAATLAAVSSAATSALPINSVAGAVPAAPASVSAAAAVPAHAAPAIRPEALPEDLVAEDTEVLDPLARFILRVSANTGVPVSVLRTTLQDEMEEVATATAGPEPEAIMHVTEFSLSLMKFFVGQQVMEVLDEPSGAKVALDGVQLVDEHFQFVFGNNIPTAVAAAPADPQDEAQAVSSTAQAEPTAATAAEGAPNSSPKLAQVQTEKGSARSPVADATGAAGATTTVTAAGAAGAAAEPRPIRGMFAHHVDSDSEAEEQSLPYEAHAGPAVAASSAHESFLGDQPAKRAAMMAS